MILDDSLSYLHLWGASLFCETDIYDNVLQTKFTRTKKKKKSIKYINSSNAMHYLYNRNIKNTFYKLKMETTQTDINICM